MRPKNRSLAVLAGILGAVLVAGACHKKQEAPPPPPPKVTLSVQPSTVKKGQAVTLSWTSQYATDLDLQPGVGKVQAQGSKSVTPQESTTYTINVTGPGGRQSATAQVSVSAPSRSHHHHRRQRRRTTIKA
jgi:hypothetical protein